MSKIIDSTTGHQEPLRGPGGQLQIALLAGEDQTNDVMKVEQQFAYQRVAADALIFSGTGLLHTATFSCTDSAPTAGQIRLYDNTVESGTVVHLEVIDSTTFFRSFTLTFDVAITTGLYIGFTTTADVTCAVSYRS